MNTTPDEFDELDDTGYLIMPLASLQCSPWPPDEKEKDAD